MKIQSRLMQARFVEIHQIFAKKIRLDTFLTDLVVINHSQSYPKIIV